MQAEHEASSSQPEILPSPLSSQSGSQKGKKGSGAKGKAKGSRFRFLQHCEVCSHTGLLKLATLTEHLKSHIAAGRSGDFVRLFVFCLFPIPQTQLFLPYSTGVSHYGLFSELWQP